jgi:hypothetical protein
MVAAALIDRLVHHATMITLKGKSYRLREPGVLRGSTEPSALRGVNETGSTPPSLRDSA